MGVEPVERVLRAMLSETLMWRVRALEPTTAAPAIELSLDDEERAALADLMRPAPER